MGEHVAADVHEHDEVAVQPPRGVRQAVADDVGAGIGVDEQDRLAEGFGHPRLREAHVAGPAGLGAGQRRRAVQGCGRR